MITAKSYQMPQITQILTDFCRGLINSVNKICENQRNLWQKNKKEVGTLKFGSLKGTFKMSKDFEEPLEDFKEYMK